MVIYQIESELAEKAEPLASREQSVYAASLQTASEAFFHSQKRQAYIFVSNLSDGKLTAAAISKRHECVDTVAQEFLTQAGIRHKAIVVKEITIKMLQSLLRMGVRNRFIEDDDTILERFSLAGLMGRFARGVDFEEAILSCDWSQEELLKKAEGLLARGTLAPEIQRIFAGAKTHSVLGHPVHYLIQTDSADVRDEMAEILLSSLHDGRRIMNRRFCTFVFDETSDAPGKQYELVYETCFGGAVMVYLSALDEEEGEYTCVSFDTVNQLCRVMRKYCNDVLTVFCLPRSQDKLKGRLVECLEDVTLVTLNEEIVFGEQARKYLRSLARKYHVGPDRSLYKNVQDESKGYLAADLNREFNLWLGKHLKTRIYPQYSSFETAYTSANSKQPRGSAYSVLMGLIGLREAKEMIEQALNYSKAQKLFRNRGLASAPLPMHMVFTGNPGTAKTTVARLFAQIMKDNGILPVGNLLEVGRADLVGKYVGWTARLVKEKFKEAQGSVLFIDEAYSLVDDRDGMFGDEAINTIVQEMENHRGNMVVIFAGYPGRMEGFLKKNPGLRSRIGFRIQFPDYSTDELFDILVSIAADSHMILAPDVRKKLMPLFRSAKTEEDYGNGRFVRNAFERARLHQASRLLEQDIDTLSKEDVMTLCADDFDMITGIFAAQPQRMIGFGL